MPPHPVPDDPRPIQGSRAPADPTARPAGGMSRRTFLGWLGAGIAGAAAGWTVATSYHFEVERIGAPLAGLRAPATIAWLADLHFGPFIRAGSVAAWVDATLALAPDLIVLGGDMVDKHAPDDLGPLLDQLARLRAPLGVYAVRGNHEYERFADPAVFGRDLAGIGIPVLVNRGVSVRDDLFLAGVDDGRIGNSRMRQLLAPLPDGSACLLASHRPDVLRLVPDRVGLTLMGHTHGGQVRLPGIGPLVTRTELGPAYVAGWVPAPPVGYVSRGLGVVHVPVRVNCPAELTLATLTPPVTSAAHGAGQRPLG